jgi:helix-turn-helix protein
MNKGGLKMVSIDIHRVKSIETKEDYLEVNQIQVKRIIIKDTDNNETEITCYMAGDQE